jgi:hypothetical protein
VTAADLTIDDLRAFGPHRLRASLLAAAIEARGVVSPDVDHFLDVVDEFACSELTRAHGAVQVQLWLESEAVVATVTDPTRSLAIRTSDADGTVVRLDTGATELRPSD